MATLDGDKLLIQIRKQKAEAKVRMDSFERGTMRWGFWEFRYDALDGVETMIMSGAYDA